LVLVEREQTSDGRNMPQSREELASGHVDRRNLTVAPLEDSLKKRRILVGGEGKGRGLTEGKEGLDSTVPCKDCTLLGGGEGCQW